MASNNVTQRPAPRRSAAARRTHAAQQARPLPGLPAGAPGRVPRALGRGPARGDPRPGLRRRRLDPQGVHLPLPPAPPEPVVRFETPPGQQAQADWSGLGATCWATDSAPAALRHGAGLLAGALRRGRLACRPGELPGLPRPRLCLLRRRARRGALRQRQGGRARAPRRRPALQPRPARLRRPLRLRAAPLPALPRPTKGKVERSIGYLKDRFFVGRRLHRPRGPQLPAARLARCRRQPPRARHHRRAAGRAPRPRGPGAAAGRRLGSRAAPPPGARTACRRRRGGDRPLAVYEALHEPHRRARRPAGRAPAPARPAGRAARLAEQAVARAGPMPSSPSVSWPAPPRPPTAAPRRPWYASRGCPSARASPSSSLASSPRSPRSSCASWPAAPTWNGPRTSCCWARPAPARRTWRSPWAWPPAPSATACASPRRPG